MSTLKIGIVSETRIQQHYLKHTVEECGYCVATSVLVEELIIGNYPSENCDAWVIDVDVERFDKEQDQQSFEQWLYGIEQPVILGEGHIYNAAEAEFAAWARQLNKKLLALDGQIQLATQPHQKAQHVWVLAASTGGPEAVKRFLDAMETDLGLGFLYAQHIDRSHIQALCDTVSRDSGYYSAIASHGDVVCENNVIIIPPQHYVELQRNGSLVSRSQQQWRGIYTPSIDQVVSNVSALYGEASGVIFFTGMGDDGAAGCRLVALHGGQVWAQSVSSCVSPSMPQEVINTGYASKIDTPENLAIHLKTFIKNQCTHKQPLPSY